MSDALRPHPSVLAERRIVYIADISAMLQDLRIQAIEFVPDAASLHRSLGISPP